MQNIEPTKTYFRNINCRTLPTNGITRWAHTLSIQDTLMDKGVTRRMHGKAEQPVWLDERREIGVIENYLNTKKAGQLFALPCSNEQFKQNHYGNMPITIMFRSRSVFEVTFRFSRLTTLSRISVPWNSSFPSLFVSL